MSEIRLANKWDLPQVCDMLRNFRSQTPIDFMRNLDDEQYMSKVFHTLLIGGGLAIVAEQDDKLVGMIFGIVNQSVWDPQLLVLQEMVFWVEPEYRNTRTGYKLLKKYCELAEAMKDTGRIQFYTMTKMVNSPDMKLDKFGFTKTEEIWVGGV